MIIRIFTTLVTAIALLGSALAQTPGTVTSDTFGSGGNQFSIDFVSIGDLGNTSDPATGYGAVPYAYRIGKYTISQNQVNAALANGLQNVTSDTLHDAIQLVGTYAGPACDISWFSAAAYVNWLNTSSGYAPAYNLVYTNGAWSMAIWQEGQAWTLGGTNSFRNAQCHYFLPSDNEWYKAAYYDPLLNGGSGGYWPYTTGSSNPPSQVSNAQLGKGGAGWNNGGAGTNANTILYGLSSWCAPADVTQCGGLSPYGTMGQGGNAAQWLETTTDELNTNPYANRKAMGYSYVQVSTNPGWMPLSSTEDNGASQLTPSSAYKGWIGFRVASTDVAPPQVIPPSISTQPSDVSLSATNSQTATFTVGVTNGVPPYGYQWMKDGVDLTNQTNASLVLSNATANTVGYYSCDVTDQNGTTVTSSNAALNITGVDFNLWQGLVAYYPFNGDFKDYSFNSNDISNYSSGILIGTNRFGNTNSSMYLSTVNDFAVSSKNLGIFGDQPHTISVWVKTDSDLFYNQNGGILAFGDTSGTTYGTVNGLSLDYGENGRILLWGSYADILAPNLGNPIYKKWHQIFYVYSNSISESLIYMDGVSLNTMQLNEYVYTNNFNLKDTPLTIGSSLTQGSVGALAAGSINDVRIYNRALSSNEVAQLYALESTDPRQQQSYTPPTISNQIYGSLPFGLTIPTNSSGLPVTARVVSGPATLVGTNLTITGTGTVTMAYDIPGDATYAPLSVTNTFTSGSGPTNRKSQSIAFTQGLGKVYGSAPFALTASATSHLPITYFSSDPTVATVSGSTVTIRGAGSTVLTAYQPGDGSVYNPANPVSKTLLVNPAAQTITFASIPGKTYGSAPLILSAKASSKLPVTYTSSDTSVLTITNSGTNTLLVPTGGGTATITASQAGNANYTAAVPVTQPVVITKANQTIAFPAPAAKVCGAPPFTLNSNSSAGMPISYSSSSTNVATISGSTVTILGAGTTTITATQEGNGNYNAAPTITRSLVVTKGSQTISFAALPSKTYGDASFTLSATASSGLPVSYVSANTNVATISGSTVTIRGAGTASITASQAGNTNFNAATAVAKTLTVAKAAQTVTFNPTSPVTYVKSGTFALSASSTASGTGTNVTFASGNTSILSISGKTATMKAKGTVSVTATAAATANYNAASTTNSITLQ
jgi:hypothetical protein